MFLNHSFKNLTIKFMKIREKYHTRIGGMEMICECGSTKHIEFFMKEMRIHKRADAPLN